jgi:hypothetical protein
MAWDSKKNKEILRCIIFGKMLWTMANLSHGTVSTENSENKEKVSTINGMKSSAADRREGDLEKSRRQWRQNDLATGN